MSGGSMNYLYERIEDVAAGLHATTIERKALQIHLRKLALALKAVEWNDSGDGAEDEPELIRACLAPGGALETAIDDAHTCIRILQQEIENVKQKPV